MVDELVAPWCTVLALLFRALVIALARLQHYQFLREFCCVSAAGFLFLVHNGGDY